MRSLFKIGIATSVAITTIYSSDAAAPHEIQRLPSDVYLSSPNYTFDTYFNALIMQPTSSNLHYSAKVDSSVSSDPNWHTYEINTDYQFGFDVGIGYVFKEASSSLILNWEHFHSNDTDSEPSVSNPYVYSPFFDLANFNFDYQKVSGKAKFWLDEINLSYGTFVNFGTHLKLNLFSGISFARIKQTLRSHFKSSEGPFFLEITTPSTFNGAGPRLGLGFSQNIVKGFNFNGSIAGAFLVGPQKNDTRYSSVLPIPPVSIQHLNPETKVQLIPSIEGNLGLAYLFNFYKHYMVNLEGGYKAQIYINPIQTIDAGSETVAYGQILLTIANRSLSPNSFTQTLSNFALAGPYVMLSMGF